MNEWDKRWGGTQRAPCCDAKRRFSFILHRRRNRPEDLIGRFAVTALRGFPFLSCHAAVGKAASSPTAESWHPSAFAAPEDSRLWSRRSGSQGRVFLFGGFYKWAGEVKGLARLHSCRQISDGLSGENEKSAHVLAGLLL